MSDEYQQVVFWSRWNFLWLASCLLPPVIILIGYPTGRWRRWYFAVIAFGVSWGLLFLSICQKWSLRTSAAVTEEDMVHATGDGANLAFSLILYGPVSSAIYVGLIMTGCYYLLRHHPPIKPIKD